LLGLLKKEDFEKKPDSTTFSFPIATPQSTVPTFLMTAISQNLASGLIPQSSFCSPSLTQFPSTAILGNEIKIETNNNVNGLTQLSKTATPGNGVKIETSNNVSGVTQFSTVLNSKPLLSPPVVGMGIPCFQPEMSSVGVSF
jgi:hypothetical protein